MNKNILKRKLFTLAPTGRESGCCNQFNYNHERGVQKYKDADRATECAMTSVGKVNKNYLQPKQPSCLAALSPAASPVTNHSLFTIHLNENPPLPLPKFSLPSVSLVLSLL